MKVKELLQVYRNALNDLYPETELLQVIFLVFEHVKGFSKIDLALKKEEFISDEEIEKFYRILSELKTSRPVQYVIGNAWFFGILLKVNEYVLIPRQETEELVDWIIHDFSNEGIGKGDGLRILDICTGSGCIAISLLKNLPGAEVTALDVSDNALSIAKENALSNNLKINFTKHNILLPFSNSSYSRFNLIVSNPPYIPESEKATMGKKELDFEPPLAFFVQDTDPLIFYKRIADFAKSYLSPGGKLYFEINETKGVEVAEHLVYNGFSDVEVRKDLNGKERMVKAILKS